MKLALLLWSIVAFAAGPEKTLEEFYKVYLAYIDATVGKERSLKKANVEERAAIDGFFTASYVKKNQSRNKACAKTKGPTPECDGNFFYCAQEAPTGVEVKNVEKSGKVAEADVVLCFNCGRPGEEKRTARAKLQLVKGAWKIDSISCP